MTADHPAILEDALGTRAASVMPELVRLAELRVRFPRYEIVMLEVAEQDALPVDEVLSLHLRYLAEAESEWLGVAIPGFDGAMRWPEA